MRANVKVALVVTAALAGCGLEGVFGNGVHKAYDRPASALAGAAAFPGAAASSYTVLDGEGVDLGAEPEPKVFLTTAAGGRYEVRLASSRYSMLRVQARSGDMALRAVVPEVGEETLVGGVDLDARNMTETLIVEARLSKDRSTMAFRSLTPAAYTGDGVATGTRTLIRKAFDVAGPAQDLLRMVERIMAKADPTVSSATPSFFAVPEVEASGAVMTSPLDSGWLQRNAVDYTGDNVADRTTVAFDAALVAAAERFDPSGCLDAGHLRLVFTVDFNDGALNGNCASFNKGKWFVPKPGKTMYFVGWVHKESEVQDPAVAAMLGNAAPNNVQMYDDGTNGDEVAGDGIYTVAFVVPFDPAKVLRIGYKYTWGLRGQVWTGSEEWPGNSRILEVVDVNHDGYVYRRDVFGDEATNKDKANLNPASGGTLAWDEALHGCGPETREQPFTLHNSCQCGSEWFMPKAIGPVRIACSE